jgi:hypothetical protein
VYVVSSDSTTNKAIRVATTSSIILGFTVMLIVRAISMVSDVDVLLVWAFACIGVCTGAEMFLCPRIRDSVCIGHAAFSDC